MGGWVMQGEGARVKPPARRKVQDHWGAPGPVMVLTAAWCAKALCASSGALSHLR